MWTISDVNRKDFLQSNVGILVWFPVSAKMWSKMAISPHASIHTEVRKLNRTLLFGKIK